jgi:predicted transcriptional regulator
MTTVTIEVATREETDARLLRAFSGEQQGSFISFPTIEALLKTLTAKRLHVIRVMLGAGSLTIREVARRVNRDVKAVHGDIQSLLAVGIIDKTDDGKVIFSYDALHMDFMLKAA